MTVIVLALVIGVILGYLLANMQKQTVTSRSISLGLILRICRERVGRCYPLTPLPLSSRMDEPADRETQLPQ